MQDPTLAFLVHDIARLMRQEYASTAGPNQATQTHLRTIAYLARMEGCTQRELAEVIDVTPMTLGRQIDQLEAAGLIERRADPSDRRCFRLWLTDRSRVEVQELRKITNSIAERATRHLAKADLDSMIRLLAVVHDTLLQDRSQAAQADATEVRHAV
jgi:DNA-binding MarR family transcriptional regulator